MLQGKFGRLESFAVSYSDWSRRIFEDMYLSINMKNITSEKLLISYYGVEKLGISYTNGNQLK